MKVFNAMQLKGGAKADQKGYPTTSSLTQPIQFLPSKQKDDDWSAWNLDWLELQGLEFLRVNARKLLKNYKLAKGIIDKKDYIIEEDNDHKDLMDVLTKEDESALVSQRRKRILFSLEFAGFYREFQSTFLEFARKIRVSCLTGGRGWGYKMGLSL